MPTKKTETKKDVPALEVGEKRSTITVGKPSFADYNDSGRQRVTVEVTVTTEENYKGAIATESETKEYTTVVKDKKDADQWLANLAEGF